ncbi:hypothetical protein ACLB1E_13370 [Escherichia coli]
MTMASRCSGEALRLMQNIYDFTPQYVVHDASAMSPASGRGE